MSQDTENIAPVQPDLSGDPSRPKKPNEWLPLIVNMCIFGAYSLFLLATVIIAKDSYSLILYALFIALQTIVCLVLFLVFLFINGKKAGIFLLSGIAVIVIGFSVCGGIADIGNKLHRSEWNKAHKYDDYEQKQQIKIDSSTKILKEDSIIQQQKMDSVNAATRK